MPVQLTTNGTEEGTYVVTAVFTDEDGSSVIPNNINWWLYDSSRNIVNARSNVSIAVPAASIDVLLQGDDLAIIGTDNRRVFRLEWDYDSSLGTGLPGKSEVEFEVTNLETYVGTLEDTLTLTVSTNTWATLAEADSYLAGRYGSSSWATLPVEARKQLLITAYRWINREYTISSVTTVVKYAQIELAWYVYEFNDSHRKHVALWAQGVEEFDISKFSEILTRPPTFPVDVEDLLKDEIRNLGGKFPLMEREVDDNA
jgi:hypothetical protein